MIDEESKKAVRAALENVELFMREVRLAIDNTNERVEETARQVETIKGITDTLGALWLRQAESAERQAAALEKIATALGPMDNYGPNFRDTLGMLSKRLEEFIERYFHSVR